jgi:phage-related protein
VTPLPDARSLKPIEWVGSSLDDLRDLPDVPRRVFGFALHEAQLGRRHIASKRLGGSLSGLIELIDDFDGNSYRAVYTVKFAGVVYVLHVFQKKSTRGIATPRRQLELIRDRWSIARAHFAKHHA